MQKRWQNTTESEWTFILEFKKKLEQEENANETRQVEIEGMQQEENKEIYMNMYTFRRGKRNATKTLHTLEGG